MTRTTAALALGSGGARGYAHIGVLQVLAEHGFDIVAISGSSMGALIAGLHVTDGVEKYVEWVSGLNQFDVMRLMDVSLGAPGVIHADKILDKVRDIIGDVVIEDLPIPYTAVATDLSTGRPAWFQRGPLDTAIRASIAIPGLITPYVDDGRVLVDGGILDPLPIAPLAAVSADVIVGVDLSAGVVHERDHRDAAEDTAMRTRLRKSASPLLENDFVRRLVERFARDEAAGDELAHVADSSHHSISGEQGRRMSWLAMMDRSLDIMQQALARHQLAALPPDILIRIPRTSMGSLDFHRAAEMIEIGRERTEVALATRTPPREPYE